MTKNIKKMSDIDSSGALFINNLRSILKNIIHPTIIENHSIILAQG